jgi:hypothetical protein
LGYDHTGKFSVEKELGDIYGKFFFSFSIIRDYTIFSATLSSFLGINYFSWA